MSAQVVGGDTDNYSYRWSTNSSVVSTAPTYRFTPPVNFVGRNDMTRDINVTLEVSDNIMRSNATITLAITKRDNGNSTFTPTVTTSTISIATEDDPDGNGVLQYVWERRGLGDANWIMFAPDTPSSYIVPLQNRSNTRYRITRASYTDNQDYSVPDMTLGPIRVDIDENNNGLIDIWYLEDLDDMRRQLDGSGYTTNDAAKITRGCSVVEGAENCRGYELRRDLNFRMLKDYWDTANQSEWTVDDFTDNSNTGWQPISGLHTTAGEVFNTTFDGNGYTISGLQINITDADRSNIGLFAEAGPNSNIRNVGVAGKVVGVYLVGGLVGTNNGNISNSYSAVTGEAINSGGGLVGMNSGEIRNSYAISNIDGNLIIGGLVGYSSGLISNAYAYTLVSGDGNVGGLVGELAGRATVENSYSIGTVSGTSGAGGLIGASTDTVVISDSYWNRETSGISISAGGADKTTMALQMPTAAGSTSTEIYFNWPSADWDFGDQKSYPILRYGSGKPENPACDTLSMMPSRCGNLLDGQPNIKWLRALEVKIGDEVIEIQPFSYTEYDYDVVIPYTRMVQLVPYAFARNNVSISITKDGEIPRVDYFTGKISGQPSMNIPLPAVKSQTIMVIRVGDVDPVTYRVKISRENPPPIDITITGKSSVNEGELVSLTVNTDDNRRDYTYMWEANDLGITAHSGASLNIRIPPDFVSRGATTRSTVLTVMANDTFIVGEKSFPMTVTKIDNGGDFTISLSASPTELRVDHTQTETDPDGPGTFAYQWQMRDEGDTEWTYLSTLAAQTISGTPTVTIRYRVMLTYADGQNNRRDYSLLNPFPAKVDIDGNGMIDIYYVEDLNAMRQLDGSSYHVISSESSIAEGCMQSGCIGYELLRDLDFLVAESYIDQSVHYDDWTVSDYSNDTDNGWMPIGNESNPFATVFKGNNHTISKLQINRDGSEASGNHVGLFGFISDIARIENVGILNVNIEGLRYAGGLVGENRGRIINSHVDAGEVKGIGIPPPAGIASNDFDARANDGIGGLVGSNDGGSLMHSYANVDVSVISVAQNDVVAGVLAGRNWNGATISNSYAIGSATGCFAGGLVGYHSSSGVNKSKISNSYARSTVGQSAACDNVAAVGSLLGFNNGSIIEYSYTTGNKLVGTDFNTPETTDSHPDSAELKLITDNTGIFANWSLAAWDFGSTQTYPLLRYVQGESTDDVACDLELNTDKPLCGNLLPGQYDEGLAGVYILSDGRVFDNETILERLFSFGTYDYSLKLSVNVTEIQMNPYAAMPSSTTISIRKHNDDTEYYPDKISGLVSSIIPIDEENTTLTIMVRNPSSTTTTYIFNVLKDVSVIVSIRVSDEDLFEGDEFILTAEAIGGGENYLYSWQEEVLAIDSEMNSDPSLTVLLPDDLVDSDAQSLILEFKVEVDDTKFFTTTVSTTTIIIGKKDNGTPNLTLSLDGPQISVSATGDPDGDSDDGIMSYQWQKRAIGSEAWVNTTTTDVYTVSGDDDGSNRYRVEIGYGDAQGNTVVNLLSQPFRFDIDDDNDGLIDIYYLEDLNTLRYQLDGSGYSASSEAVKITRGCRTIADTENCNGYELRRDLDFDLSENYLDAIANQSDWTESDYSNSTDTGWLPIGDDTDLFNTLLDGNNYVISNLQINRDNTTGSKVALFGVISKNAEIRNIGILDVRIEGNGDTGSLVAENRGVVINTYAKGGSVSGLQNRVGGLVAINGNDADATGGEVIVNSYANVITTSTEAIAVGALVATNKGIIMNSYASGNAAGPCDVGGLVGENRSNASIRSQIINSYMSGEVIRLGSCAEDAARDRAGGLVAYNEGLIRNSYVRGQITSGSGTVGALVAEENEEFSTAVIESSYWDSTVNSHITSDDLAKTTEELIMPIAAGTTPTDIYYQWSPEAWDFGTTRTYPVLRYDQRGCDSDSATAYPLCGSLLFEQRDGLNRLLVVANNKELDNDEVFIEQIFSSLETDYNIKIPYATEVLRLRPYVNRPREVTISIKDKDDNEYFADKRSGELSDPIPSASVPLIVEIKGPGSTVVSYTLNTNSFPLNILKENIRVTAPAGNPQTIDEDVRGVTLEVSEVSGGFGTNYSYQWTTPTLLILGSGLDGNSITFDVPSFFVEDSLATTRSLVLEVTVNDGFSPAFTQSKELIINKIDHGSPDLTVIGTPSYLMSDLFIELRVNISGADPDGIGTFDYQWQARPVGEPQWTNVGFNIPYHIVPNNESSGIRYRVQIIQTDDRNNKVTSLLGPFRMSVDDDQDGLIDIYYLEDLNAIRYSMSGSSYKESATATPLSIGCPSDGCNGYELRRDLDFNDNTSYSSTSNKVIWTSGAGWNPIDFNADSTFEGNDYAIYNLFINNEDKIRAGLFGSANGSVIRRVGLIDVNITNISEEDTRLIGGLAGFANATIENSYVTGIIQLEGDILVSSETTVGGLVGSNSASISNSFTNITIDKTDDSNVSFIGRLGGLVASNTGSISNSYAVVYRTIRSNAGGGELVSVNDANIHNSYAHASADIASVQNSLHLVGTNGDSSISNSYIVANGGAFAFMGDPNAISNSYWNSETGSSSDNGKGGEPKSTMQLQMPTAPASTSTKAYYTWSENDWDFGNTMQYPILKDSSACSDTDNEESSQCAIVMPNQHRDLRRLLLSTGSFLEPQNFQYAITDYEVVVPIGTTEIQLTPIAFHTGTGLKIIKQGETPEEDYFAGKNSGAMSETIILGTGITTTIIVEDTFTSSVETTLGTERRPRQYRLSVKVESESSLTIETIDGVPASATTEGVIIHLMADVSGNFKETLTYQWNQSSGATVLNNVRTDRSELIFEIPKDLVDRNADSVDIELTLTVDDGTNTADETVSFTVNKIDNGPFESIVRRTDERTLEASIVMDDPDGNGAFRYIWEQRGINDLDWVAAAGANEMSEIYNVMLQSRGDIFYRVRITYTDMQGYDNEEILGPYRTRANIDDDDDGLIDIYYLEDLNAIRYSMNGKSYIESAEATPLTIGCPADGCDGYELRRDLDFATTQSYMNAAANKAAWTVDDFSNVSDTGWDPIGDVSSRNCNDADNDCFNSIFEGNGNRISNLQINRDEVALGLFAGNRGSIRNIGLAEPEIEGDRIISALVGLNHGTNDSEAMIVNSNVVDALIKGSRFDIGGLVGVNGVNTIIINSYANGEIIGRSWLGGLAGANAGRIINSYADSIIKGRAGNMGGLVGQNGTNIGGKTAAIENSYAWGSVSSDGTEDTVEKIGGLIGFSFVRTNVSNSYAIGEVKDSSASIGGLIGSDSDASELTVTSSYWDTNTSGQTRSEGGDSKTTEELIMPIAAGTTPTDIYYQWNPADWDFGDTESYPALRYNEVEGVDACDSDPNTVLPRCGDLIPNQRIGLKHLLLSENVRLEGVFNYTVRTYDAIVPNETPQIHFTPTAFNSSATIQIIVSEGDGTDYSRGHGMESDTIMLDTSTPTVIIITVAAEDERLVQYKITVEVLEEFIVADTVTTVIENEEVDRSELSEGETVRLNINVSGGQSEGLSLQMDDSSRRCEHSVGG